jgi:hypothetical protein
MRPGRIFFHAPPPQNHYTPAMRRFLFSLFCGAALCMSAACREEGRGASPPASEAPEAGPQMGLAEAAVLLPSGTRLRVELAVTPAQRAKGLMHRDSLPEDRGMLFLFSFPDAHFFWMRDTKIALDILWLDAEGKILHVVRGAEPCSAMPCPHYAPPEGTRASFVLEIGEGQAARYGLEEGVRLRFEGVPSPEDMQTGAFSGAAGEPRLARLR